MDFRGRGNQNTTVSPTQPANRSITPAPTSTNQASSLKKHTSGKIFQYGSIVLLFAVTALVVSLTFLLAFGGASVQRSVQKDKYQAVFLNNGQVYFGNIKSINDKTYDLRGIYYLQTNGGTDAAAQTSTTTATNVSLVKLGCELHAPYDQMLINANQVLFWENLQSTGQVVQAITKYKTDNAKKACSTTSQNSTQQAPSTTTPGAVTTPTPPTIKKP